KFQSLLCWIWPVGRAESPHPRTPRRSFNPCCAGFGPSAAAGRGGPAQGPSVSILVVLDLARRLGPVELAPRRGGDVSILVVLDLARRRPPTRSRTWRIL